MSARCWLNGRVQDAAAVRIDSADRGFCLGDGVFETIAVRHGVARHLGRHLARLHEGRAVLRLGCPFDDAVIGAAIGAIAGGEGSIRITLSRGPAPRGLLPPDPAHPTLLINWAERRAPTERVTAILCRSTSRHQGSPLARVKSLNYLDGVLARIEADEAGVQEGILLNTVGRVAEASASNIVALIDGRLVTPPVADGALPGITRGLLIDRGAVERSLGVDDLHRAKAVFLTSSLAIRELAALDGTVFAPAPDWLARLREDTA